MEKMKCIKCGKKAKYISFKFASPLCAACAKKEVKKIAQERGELNPELEDYYTEPCEEMNNIEKRLEVFNSVG